MSRLIVSNIETQNIKFDSDTTAFTIGSDGVLSGTCSPAMVKLYSLTSSSTVAAHDIDSTYINSTYKRYTLEIFDLQCATDNQPLQLEFSTDNGSSYLTGSCDRLNIGTTTDEGNDAIKSRNTASNDTLQISGGTNFGTGTGEVGALTIQLVNFLDTAHYKLIYYTGAKINNDGAGGIEFGGGSVRTTSAVNAVKFRFSSGNITAGTFVLYGIN